MISLLLVVLLLFVAVPQTFAFNDIANIRGEKEILALKEKGIIVGLENSRFAPEDELTYAQAVTFITRAFELSLAHITLEAGVGVNDFFTNVEDGKWYSDSFMIAHLNDIHIDKNVKPNDVVTKEVFADLLFQAMTNQNEMAFIEIYMILEDEDEVTPELMNSVQKMVISNITPLENGYFYPQKQLNRKEAAIMIYNTLEFIKNFPKE